MDDGFKVSLMQGYLEDKKLVRGIEVVKTSQERIMSFTINAVTKNAIDVQ